MAVPYTFGSATAAIPLSQLDSNFASTITLGNTAIQLGNTVTILSNMTFGNVTVTSGNVTVTNANVTSITASSDSYISGLTVGKGAGAVSTNTAVGASALAANTSGANNVAVGYQAGYTNTTGAVNTFVGRQAAYLNTTGSNLVAVGQSALYSNTTGGSNVAIGDNALAFNTTASNNTAVGYQAGYSNITGGSNTYIGRYAGYTNTASGNNLCVGDYAGYFSTGADNTFVGARGGSASGDGAGYSMTTGSKNTIIGKFGGNQSVLDIRTASNYIVLSDGDGTPAAYRKTAGDWWFGVGGTGSDNQGVITLNGNAPAAGNGAYINGLSNGTNAWAIGSYRAVVGGTATWFTCANSGGGGVYLNGASATSWTVVSDETRKVIIEPITDAANKVSTLRAVIGRLKTDDETVRRPYLIAQDVQAVLPEAVTEAEDKEGAVLGLSYTEVIPLLVAAIKELKAEIDTLKAAK